MQQSEIGVNYFKTTGYLYWLGMWHSYLQTLYTLCRARGRAEQECHPFCNIPMHSIVYYWNMDIHGAGWTHEIKENNFLPPFMSSATSLYVIVLKYLSSTQVLCLFVCLSNMCDVSFISFSFISAYIYHAPVQYLLTPPPPTSRAILTLYPTCSILFLPFFILFFHLPIFSEHCTRQLCTRVLCNAL